MARPKKEIDYTKVLELSSIMCTQEEIANILGVDRRTLLRDEEFCHIYKKGMDNGRESLRRKQFKLADNNATMAIWLGKQYLGQKDIVNHEIKDTRVVIKNDLLDIEVEKEDE